MNELNRTLDAVRQRIASHKGSRGLNEQNTKGALIEPVLRALGWDIEDPDEVSREFKSKKRDKPVDYALRVMRSPRLFVEAKALGAELADRKWAGQIMGYASVAGVQWAVLTDGNEYRIYNSHAPVDVDEKLFRRFVLTDDRSDRVLETLQLLSREEMEANRLEALWSMHFVDQQVHKTLASLFADEPDEALVRLVRKQSKGLSANEVRASLQRLRISLDFPAVSPDQLPAPTADKAPRPSSGKPAAVPAAASATLEELLQSGHLNAPVELEKRYRGQDLQARIEASGAVVFDGESYPSLSAAGGAARAKVLGGGDPPATNGWKFWRYRDGHGQLHSLAELRDRYRR